MLVQKLLLVVMIVIVLCGVVQVDRRPACTGPSMDNSFLEEGSPTMVEKGMDPASVFEMCDDDDDNGIHDVKDPGAGAAEGSTAAAAGAGAAGSAASLTSSSESSALLRHRRRGRSAERPEPKTKRESWMDPPEERESTTLTQAEMESCMQTFAVRGTDVKLHTLHRVLTTKLTCP